MNTRTIYSGKYDLNENMVNGGMSGKIFMDMENCGQEFHSIDEAIDYCVGTEIPIDQIMFMYLSKDGSQKFMRFTVLNN